MAMNIALSCAVVFAFLQISIVAGAQKFSYRESDANGPSKWAKLFPEKCGGKSQSPINIETEKVQYESLEPLTFTGFEGIPSGAKITAANNGHTYVIRLSNPASFSVAGGGLPGTFRALQFHFHWGTDNSKGSEHTIDGKKYPAAMHFVNYNTKYADVYKALPEKDGLAALGVFFEIGETNEALEAFLQYITNVTVNPANVTDLPQPRALASLLPVNYTTQFYRYSGGLTTPDCNEVVTWTIFKNTLKISNAQLVKLRSMKENNVTLFPSVFRPVQPLNSRVVSRTFDPPSGACHMTNTMATFVSLVVIAIAAVLY